MPGCRSGSVRQTTLHFFEERGLALHVQILVAQAKHAAARPLAQRYIERFPHGELRSLMVQEASK
jgi:hypothetical protein